MKNGIIIREATEKDIPEIAELNETGLNSFVSFYNCFAFMIPFLLRISPKAKDCGMLIVIEITESIISRYA